jgi:NAD(P)H-hydrate epimerase
MNYISREQMALVDKVAVENYGLSVEQMMENAGKNVARFIFINIKPRKVVVLYGKGNNGGDGLNAARHLNNNGIDVKIVRAFSGEGNREVEREMKILKELGIEDVNTFDIGKGDVIIDAMLGYNIEGNPKGKFAELINLANGLKMKGVKIVSFDLPSGMDPDSGSKGDPTIDSDFVMTLALPKRGLKGMENLYLVNIGIPNELYKKELGIETGNIFEKGDVIMVRD